MFSVLLLHDRLSCWQFILHRIKHWSWLDIESHRGRRGVSLAPIVVVLIVLTTTVVEIIASRATAIVIVILVCPLRFYLILHDKDDLLNQLNDVWFLENAQIRWHALCVQPSLVVKISLIFLFMYLPFADLGDFIVSYEEKFTILLLIIVEICTSSSCVIRLLETDKGSARWHRWVMTSKDLDALCLTESRK